MARSKIEFEKLRQQYHLSLDKSGEVMKIFSQKWAAQHVQTTQLVQSEISVTPGEGSQKFYKLAAKFLRKAEANAKADVPKFEAQSNRHRYAFDLRMEWRPSIRNSIMIYSSSKLIKEVPECSMTRKYLA